MGEKATHSYCDASRGKASPAPASWSQRGRRFLRDFEWPIVGALGLVAIALGYVGYDRQFRSLGAPHSPWNIAYFTLQLFVLEMSVDIEPPLNPMLCMARFLAPAVAGYTVLKALLAVLAGQFESFRLRVLRGHVVICGLGRKGLRLAKGFLDRNERVVAIERDEQNDFIRQCRDLGAIVLVGDMASPLILRRAGVHRARYLFAVSGDDGANAEVAVNACRLLSDLRARRSLTCIVHVFDPQLCLLLRERELAAAEPKEFRIEFFNVFDAGATMLVDAHPVLRPDSPPDASVGEIVVIGVGQLGESLIVTAARRWHTRRGTSGPPLKVTLVDLHATRIAKSLSLRFPTLDKVCELRPLDLDVRSPEFHQAVLQGKAWGRDGTMVYVCLDDDSFGLSTALTLVQPLRECQPTVVVRMTEEAGLAALLHGVERGSFQHLRPFGLLDNTCRPDLVLHGTHEILARAIHEQYCANQVAHGDTREKNPSLAPWNQLSECLKDSNRQQAAHLGAKLKAVGCGLAIMTDWNEPLFAFAESEVETMARMEHQRWMDERTRAGWTYAPPPKDSARKTNPCLVPYDQLPETEKQKDRDTVREIPRFLARVGFKVYRVSKA